MKHLIGKKPTHVACFDEETGKLSMPIEKFFKNILCNAVNVRKQ